MNPWEFLVLAVIALLVFGPDKLPTYAAQAGRVLRQVRQMASDAREEVSRELGPEFRDISLSDLDPRQFVTKHLLDGEDFDLDAPVDKPDKPPGKLADNGGSQRPPYDADAT